MLEQIIAHQHKENQLRKDIEEHLATKAPEGFYLGDLDLDHRILEREPHWLSVDKGKVFFQSSKGYYDHISEVPLDDLKIVVEYLKNNPQKV